MNTLVKIKEYDAHGGPSNVKMGGDDHAQTSTTVGRFVIKSIGKHLSYLSGLTNIKIYFSLLLICSLAFSCSYWHKPHIKYLIPEGYEGMVVIAWGQKKGAPNVKEGEFEVYKIPVNGFLRTQMDSRNIAPVEEKFYSYNLKTGKRTELEVINADLVKDTITKDNQIYQLRGFSGGHAQGSYMVLYLTKNRDYKVINFKNQEEIDRKINELFNKN
ncbi:hypothetical protein QFZ20_005486 [Flavobacterium sp. W4I14]|nr:hypothetical protein [Flavobacterium sp. W4I14]